MDELLKQAARTGKEVQIKLRGDMTLSQGIGGIGPGKIGMTDYEGLYTIEQMAQMGTDSGPRTITMKFYFAAADVVWLTEGPEKAAEEASRLVTPSGIHLGSS